jgi:hypothetical protein
VFAVSGRWQTRVVAEGDSGAGPGAGLAWRWDVALSFAAPQRDYLEQVAAALRACDVHCFYDADEQVELWGRHLAEELPAIYAGRAGVVVVVFISAKYAAGDWTRLERRCIPKAPRQACRRCPPTCGASMTRSWPGWWRPRPATVVWRCWWAGCPPVRPGRAGSRWGCCGARTGHGGYGTRSIRPAPDAALRELPRIGPRTVVWLNEAQFYLDVAGTGLGERVAAGLRELLRDPARAPVLVLATLWPAFWDTPDHPPAERRRPPHACAGAAGRPRHHGARRVHPGPGGWAGRGEGCAAGAGRRAG